MRDLDRELMLRCLGGEPEPADRAALRTRMEADPSLRAAWERMRSVETLVTSTREEAFAPGFADRVVCSLSAATSAPVIVMGTALRRQFLRLAPAALVVLLALGAHNVLASTRPPGQSVWEAALGLQPVTLDEAYGLDTTLYAALSAEEDGR
jgi:hypothetical protein